MKILKGKNAYDEFLKTKFSEIKVNFAIVEIPFTHVTQYGCKLIHGARDAEGIEFIYKVVICEN